MKEKATMKYEWLDEEFTRVALSWADEAPDEVSDYIEALNKACHEAVIVSKVWMDSPPHHHTQAQYDFMWEMAEYLEGVLTSEGSEG